MDGDAISFENALIGDQKRGLDYFLEQIKLTMFQVLYVLRKDEEQEDGLTAFYFFNAVDYFQIHQFPFYVTIYKLWKQDAFMEFINQVQNLFSISSYIPNLTYDSLLITVYTLLFFILLIIADIMYVSYSFSRNKFYAMWPLYILRSIASLVVTVLFLPITETLTAIIQCSVDADTGKYIIYGYDNIFIECWVGWHTFHALIDLAFIGIFVVICAGVAYAFFEPGMTSKDRSARQDSWGEVSFITNKITCQLMYSLLRPNYPEQAWMLVIVTFVLSLWLFKIYNFDDPYYDFQVGVFYCICTTYYLWATFLLLVCKILEDSSFTGGFIAWIVGVPFIVSIMLLTKKSKIETLISSQTKFRSGEQIWSHIRYVLQLIQNQEKDKNSYMLLVGYIEKHKETCENDDCPLKTNKGRKFKKGQFGIEMSEMVRGLIQELDRMFVNGLKKFPNSTELRIFYALFLYERRKNKQKALEQFEIAQSTKPAIYQQFIIYRYSRDIKKGNNKIDGKEGEDDDIVNAIAFNNHIVLCEEMIKISANLHKEFWIELKDDQPDLGRLMSIGGRISMATNSAKENYFKMQKINSTVPQTIKIFGTFMINVLNDNKKGKEMLLQAKQLREAFKKSAQLNKEIINLELQPIPFLYVSAKKTDQGSILNTNSLFTTFFGYGKEEIIGKKINLLMPDIYVNAHDKYMHQFFENIVLNLRMEAQTESEYLDIDQSRLFKHKNGYIFSLTYRVLLHLDALMYIVTFKGEATLKSQSIFIVDKQSEIVEMSTGAITFFDMDIKMIQQDKQIKLNTYVPDVLKKNGKDVVCKIDNKDTQYYFHCTVKEITFPKRNKDDSVDEDNKVVEQSGYFIVKLDRIEKNEANLKYISKKQNQNSGSVSGKSGSAHSDTVVQLPSKNQIQMFINPASNSAQSVSDSQIPLRMGQNHSNDFLDIDQKFVTYMQDLYEMPKIEEFKDMFKNMNAETDSLPSIDYAGNIVTKRLIQGQILMINEEQEELFLQVLEEQEEENSLFRNNNNEFEDEDDYRIFTYSNSANLIQEALNAHHQHGSVTTFTFYSTLWMGFVLSVTIGQYFFVESQFVGYKQDLEILEIVNHQLVQTNRLTSRVMDLCIRDQQLYQFQENEIEDDIKQSADSLIRFNLQINSDTFLDFSSDYFKLIKFRFFDNGGGSQVNNITLETSLLLFSSLALNCSIADDVSLQNPYVMGVLFNFFNLLNTEIINISDSLYLSIKDVMDNQQVNLILLLVASIFVSVMAMFKFISLMFEIKTKRENILFLFLDIPVNHVEVLYKKCDRFLKNYVSIQELKNKNEMDGYESSEDEQDFDHLDNAKVELDEDEEENVQKQTQNRKKIIKKYRQNRIKGNKGIIIQFNIIAAFTLIFTVVNIASSSAEQAQINFLLPQYYYSMYTANNYAYYINIQKQMLLNYSTQIYNQSIQDYALNNLSVFTKNAVQLNGFNYELLDKLESIRDRYMQVYYGDMCQTLNSSLVENCSNILNKNLELGVYSVEANYLQYFRRNLETFNDNVTEYSELLSSQQLYEIDRSLYDYLYEAVHSVVIYEKQFLNDQMDSTSRMQVIILSIFTVVLTGIFLFIWIPYLNRLNTEINQTIEMLNMVPLNVIKENKSIRRFVKDLIKQMKIY